MVKRPKKCRHAIQAREFAPVEGCWVMTTVCDLTNAHFNCGNPYNTKCIAYQRVK